MVAAAQPYAWPGVADRYLLLYEKVLKKAP